MTIKDQLYVFQVGQKVTAEETNDNNDTLEYWAKDNSASETYIDGKIAELNSTYSDQLNAINTQISSVNSQLTSLNSAAVKQSAIKKNNDDIYLELTNGLKFQAGYFTAPSYRTTTEVTLKHAFTNNTYKVFFSSQYEQSAGDKGSSCAIKSRTTSKFVFYSGFEGSTPRVYYFAYGY